MVHDLVGYMKKMNLSVLIVLMGCSASVPPKVNIHNKSDFFRQMGDTRVEAASFVAETRITYFKKGKRLKGTATIVAKQPGNLRYEILGPHGGVLEAFATNGKEFQLAKLAESRFFYGPATPDLLDRLLPFAPLRMTSTGWVELLFGQVHIPEGASFSYGKEIGFYRIEFYRGDTKVLVLVDPKTTKIHEIQGAVADKVQYVVRIAQ